MTGVWKNGQVFLDGPADWPEGCRVTVEPAAPEQTLGIREEDWPSSPEAIADWLAWYDSLMPIEMTAEEEADLDAWRQRVKDHTIANMSEDIEGIWQ